MTHLSRSELLRWRDAPAEADRAAIVAHLAVCDRCVGEYAELVRAQPIEQPRPTLNIADFAAAGTSQRVSPVVRALEPSAGAGLRWAMAAAAVTLLALVSWQMYDGQRLRDALARAEAAGRARELESAQQLRAERGRADEIGQQLQDERNARQVLERELARQREPVSAGQLLSLFLTPGRVRSGGETKMLTIPTTAGRIRLLLDLGEPRAAGSYEVAIVNADGKEVWRRSRVTPGNQVLMVTVPSTALPEDDYEIDVRRLTPSDALERVAEYYFAVRGK